VEKAEKERIRKKQRISLNALRGESFTATMKAHKKKRR
jgi:hypothetical protein